MTTKNIDFPSPLNINELRVLLLYLKIGGNLGSSYEITQRESIGYTSDLPQVRMETMAVTGKINDRQTGTELTFHSLEKKDENDRPCIGGLEWNMDRALKEYHPNVPTLWNKVKDLITEYFKPETTQHFDPTLN